MPDRPVAGQLETRAHRASSSTAAGCAASIPYGVESRDLGGWREVIDPAALRGAELDDLVATVEHAGVPIGRYPAHARRSRTATTACTGRRAARSSRADVRRGRRARRPARRLAGACVVARERWDGDVRHVLAIAELRDVAADRAPAYPSAAVELRHAPEEDPPCPRRPRRRSRRRPIRVRGP